MKQHKLVLLLITAFLIETVLYVGFTETASDATFVQSNQREWSRQVDDAARASSFLLPASTGIENPAENHHLFDHGTNCPKSIINQIRLARNLELSCWRYFSPAKIVRHKNSYSFRISPYPSIPITFRKLLI
jgi:hypothetical protein